MVWITCSITTIGRRNVLQTILKQTMLIMRGIILCPILMCSLIIHTPSLAILCTHLVLSFSTAVAAHPRSGRSLPMP